MTKIRFDSSAVSFLVFFLLVAIIINYNTRNTLAERKPPPDLILKFFVFNYVECPKM